MGSYNLVDSMKQGIPIIVRNTDTLINLVYDKKFAYNNYEEIDNIEGFKITDSKKLSKKKKRRNLWFYNW